MTEQTMDDLAHRCPLPDYHNRLLTWLCGTCGRAWQPGEYGWTEIRGPMR